ncbi:hypothetical protein B0F90DRAFT_1584144, partial [Multifurca ochricompacta]
LPVLVKAQYGYGDPNPVASSSSAAAPSASTSSSSGVNVDVAPGGQLTFNPANFNASNGTVVTFTFPSAGPHSVTQSTFANPCTYLAAAGSSPGGFDSGLQESKQFSIKITNDQEPIWFYCKAAIHCGLGMVGSINAPSSGNTGAAFLAAAKAIGSNEKTVSDNGPVTGGVNAVATTTPSASSSSSGSKASSTSKSDAGRIVANSIFALLAAAFGITLA